jgi:predicted HicB family RNase H-like nuclease
MAMNDDSMVKIMESLGLDYGPADRATKAFESRIASLNKQLFDMKVNAMKGAGDINRAFSSQLGQIGGNKTILDQFGQPLKVLNDNVASSFAKATTAANKHGHAVHGVAQEYNILGSEFQRRAQWFLTGSLFYGTIKAATETVQTISEVEMGVTQIARVMEDSSFVFKDYRDELLQLGVDYGQTFDTVQDIALRWAQAGYNVKDSLELTKTGLLALNSAELDAATSTKAFTGIMAQWGLTAKDLPLVLDIINKTADDYVVESQDLVDGLLKSSATAKQFGLSLEETIALLTVMKEASGATGKEVGNAFKSILSYTQRPIAIKTFEGLGISVFSDSAKTQFNSAMDIFEQIAAKWESSSAQMQDGFIAAADDAGLLSDEVMKLAGSGETWNDIEKRDLAQSASGVYRRTQFIALVTNLAQAQEVLNGMTDAAGYSQAENARTMDTLEKKYTSLKAAMQEVAVALGDAGLLDALKSITGGATDAADRFADLSDETKTLILTVLELVAAIGMIKGVGGLLTAKNIFFGAESVLALAAPWGKLAAVIATVVGALGLFIYNSSKASAQSIQDSLNSANAKKSEVDESNKLIEKYQELEGKAVQSNEVKAEMLDIQRQLAAIYPGYVDGLDSEGNKIITNIPLLREMNALKQQEIDLERQKIMMDAKTRLPQLQADQKRLQWQIDKNKEKLASGDTVSTFTWRGQTTKTDTSEQIRKDTIKLVQELSASQLEEQMMKSVLGNMNTASEDFDTTLSRRKSGNYSAGNGAKSGGGISLPATFTEESLKALYQANKLSLQTYLSGLRKLVKTDYSEFVGKTSQELNDMLNNSATAEKAKEYLSLEQEIQNTTKKSSSEKNEALQDSLKLLDHQRNMSEETLVLLEKELNDLKVIRDTYSMSGEERMDLEERIYNTEKTLKDKALQDSINWINEKKALGEMSAEQEIAAWNRVRTNQKGNIEAVKEATQNLYRLQKELRENEVQENKDSLKDLQDSIKDSYDERIDFIEKESEKKIKAIDDELEALDREESGYDYDTKMADLEEQEAYWSVRTGEEARKNLADIREQIAEAEHDREVELQKQGLEDEKNAIEDAADAEKAKWEAAYKDMEKTFNDHNLDIIAQAATYSKEAYQQWYDNYIVPMQNALKNGDAEGFGNAIGGIGGSISNLPSHDWGMAHEDYTQFIANGKAWYSASEADKALLQAQNDALRVKYGRDPSAGEYPQFHTGGQSLSEGWAKVLPGELFFPASLSTDLKTLIAVSSGITGKVAKGDTYSTTDNRKEVKIGTLLSVENMNMEDEIDGETLARELNRAVLSLA